MAFFNGEKMGVDERHESRDPANIFVKIKVLDGKEESSFVARAVDLSRSGICLLTYKASPIGTHIAVSLSDGEFLGVGEVVNIDKEWDWWEWPGQEHMGLRFIKETEK